MAKGYAWTLDGPLPVLEDHSRAKHDVLRDYVVNYLRILALSPRSERVRVTFVDGFAGGGRYRLESGAEVGGSPLVLLDALKEARALVAADRLERGIRTPYTIDAQLHLVEQDESTFRFLSKVIAEHPDAHSPNTNVVVHKGAFESTLPSILADIRQRQKGGRSVFILDQYGWSTVDVAMIRSIFEQLPSAEVFLTWMVDNLLNFLSSKTADKLEPGLQRAGLGPHLSAAKLLSIKASDSAESDLTWKRAIQSLLTEEIRASSGATFCTPFYIIPRESRRGYWLLHLAQHLRANEEMKRIHWKNNNLHHPGGLGFNMLGFVGSRGQLAFDHRFDDNASRITSIALQEDIPRRLSQMKTPVRFGELIRTTANETPANYKQMQDAVFSLENQRKLIVRTAAGAKRRTSQGLSDDDAIELPTQMWLLPN